MLKVYIISISSVVIVIFALSSTTNKLKNKTKKHLTWPCHALKDLTSDVRLLGDLINTLKECVFVCVCAELRDHQGSKLVQWSVLILLL